MLSQGASRAASGVVWAGFSQAGRIVFQLVALAVLSRLLPPSDFGLLAMATVVTTFAALLRDMGTSAAVIQRDHLSGDLLDTIFWFNICLGLGLGIAILILAVPMAVVFREPRLTGVLFALAVTFPLVTVGAVHQSLLERSLRFRVLAGIEISSAMLALVIAIVAARNGMGVYSLVFNTIAMAAFTSLQLWFASSWRPTRRWSTAALQSIWRFSSNLFGFQVVNYFARNADTMLIGRFLGATDVGWYNLGYRIMLFPLTSLSAVMTRALFPVLSRRQRDTASFAALYLKTVSSIAVVAAPLMAGLWALREPVVETLLGKHWLPVAPVLAWLAPVGMVQSLLTTVGLIYMSTGNTKLMLRWGVSATVLVILAIALGLSWGYLGVAKSYAIATLLLLYPGFTIPLKLIGLTFYDVFRSVLTPHAIAVAMAIFLVFLDRTLFEGERAISRLVLLGLTGAAFYFFAGFFLMRSKMIELIGALLGRDLWLSKP